MIFISAFPSAFSPVIYLFAGLIVGLNQCLKIHLFIFELVHMLFA